MYSMFEFDLSLWPYSLPDLIYHISFDTQIKFFRLEEFDEVAQQYILTYSVHNFLNKNAYG